MRYIILPPGLALCRWSRLNSNVRPQNRCPRHSPQRLLSAPGRGGHGALLVSVLALGLVAATMFAKAQWPAQVAFTACGTSRRVVLVATLCRIVVSPGERHPCSHRTNCWQATWLATVWFALVRFRFLGLLRRFLPRRLAGVLTLQLVAVGALASYRHSRRSYALSHWVSQPAPPSSSNATEA